MQQSRNEASCEHDISSLEPDSMLYVRLIRGAVCAPPTLPTLDHTRSQAPPSPYNITQRFAVNHMFIRLRRQKYHNKENESLPVVLTFMWVKMTFHLNDWFTIHETRLQCLKFLCWLCSKFAMRQLSDTKLVGWASIFIHYYVAF